MLLKELTDRISALPSGAIVTDGNRFDFGYVQGTLITYRSNYIRDYYATKNKFLNNKWYQDYYPEYNADDQDNKCCVKFRCPDVITLDLGSDGLRYVGSENGNAFTRIKNRGSYSTFSKHRYTNPQTIREISFLYNASTRMLEVYGDLTAKEIKVEALFSNPADPLIATFNKEADQYPIPEDAIPTIEQMIYLGQTRITSVTAPTPAGTSGLQPKQSKNNKG